jgi:hypothetical protein
MAGYYILKILKSVSSAEKLLDSSINSIFELYNLFNWNTDLQVRNILRRKIRNIRK